MLSLCAKYAQNLVTLHVFVGIVFFDPDPDYVPRPQSHQAYLTQPTTQSAPTDWVLDSGATHHVTSDLNIPEWVDSFQIAVPSNPIKRTLLCITILIPLILPFHPHSQPSSLAPPPPSFWDLPSNFMNKRSNCLAYAWFSICLNGQTDGFLTPTNQRHSAGQSTPAFYPFPAPCGFSKAYPVSSVSIFTTSSPAVETLLCDLFLREHTCVW